MAYHTVAQHLVGPTTAYHTVAEHVIPYRMLDKSIQQRDAITSCTMLGLDFTLIGSSGNLEAAVRESPGGIEPQDTVHRGVGGYREIFNPV